MSADAKRLERIAESLTPQQAVLAWMAEAQKFDSMVEYARWLAGQPRSPLNALTEQTAAHVRKSSKGRSKAWTEDRVRKEIREVSYLFFLVMGMNAHFFAGAEERKLKARELLGLLDGSIIESIARRDVSDSLLSNFSKVAYPLHFDDALALRAAMAKRVITFAALEERIGRFGTQAEIARSNGNSCAVEDNPVVEWVRAQFARDGNAAIPQEAYVARERGEYRNDWPAALHRFGLSPQELSALFGDADAYSDFVSGKDFSYGLAGVRDRDFDQAVASVATASRQQVESGAIEGGSEIGLEPVPLEFLRRAPLVEGKYVDLYVIDLAEAEAMLKEQGFEQVKGGDGHPLAWPVFSRKDGSEIDEAIFEKQFAQHMGGFSPPVVEIDGRNYVDVARYRGWKKRKAGGELEVEYGFTVESFNRWVEQLKISGRAELAGIRIEQISQSVAETDFVTYDDPDAARDAQNARREMVARISELGVANDRDLSRWLDLFTDYVEEVLMTKAVADYIERKCFAGHQVLWPNSARELNSLVELAEQAARTFDNLNALPAGAVRSQNSPLPRRLAADKLEEVRKSIDPRMAGAGLVRLSRAKTLGTVGDDAGAIELIADLLKE